jgi:hypothetical protein
MVGQRVGLCLELNAGSVAAAVSIFIKHTSRPSRNLVPHAALAKSVGCGYTYRRT